jgi:hypothetical protein
MKSYGGSKYNRPRYSAAERLNVNGLKTSQAKFEVALLEIKKGMYFPYLLHLT